VYEGAKQLEYIDGTLTNGTFAIAITENSNNNLSINSDGKLKIDYCATNGNATYTITVKRDSDGSEISQEYKIYWKVVSDGSSPYSIDLSNDSAVIVTDPNGDCDPSAYGVNAQTTATVYCGSKQDTGWTFSVNNPGRNLAYAISIDKRTVAVSKMVGDSGEIIFTATKTGYPT
jgi:hypothetical protein